MSDKKIVLWIFMHLAKTGGTTFNGHLMKHLEFDREYIHFGPEGKRYREEHKALPFPKRDLEERKQAVILAGHKVKYGIHKLVPGKEYRYLTFLRDPADRLVSGYNFKMSRKKESDSLVTFDKWYSNRPRNAMTKFYLTRCEKALKTKGKPDARSLLELFWYVGVTESLNADLPFLFNSMGLPTEWVNYRVADLGRENKADLDHFKNLSPHKLMTLTDELRERIYKDNRKDLLLYQRAKELNEEFKRKHDISK